jgi:hypothetical protein
VPPQGAALLMPWLKAGNYKTWHCEAAEHKSNPISPHTNAVRVCTNDALHGTAAGAASPVNAAAVKEIWSDYPGDPDAGADSGAPTIVGYAVEIKTAADTAPIDGGPHGDGSNWYYFEQIGTMTPYADGKGAPGCVPCHSAAASDTTTHAGHGDFTYLDP